MRVCVRRRRKRAAEGAWRCEKARDDRFVRMPSMKLKTRARPAEAWSVKGRDRREARCGVEEDRSKRAGVGVRSGVLESARGAPGDEEETPADVSSRRPPDPRDRALGARRSSRRERERRGRLKDPRGVPGRLGGTRRRKTNLEKPGGWKRQRGRSGGVRAPAGRRGKVTAGSGARKRGEGRPSGGRTLSQPGARTSHARRDDRSGPGGMGGGRRGVPLPPATGRPRAVRVWRRAYSPCRALLAGWAMAARASAPGTPGGRG